MRSFQRLSDVAQLKYDVLASFARLGLDVLPGAPLVLQHDPSTLFVCANIQPWKDWVLSPALFDQPGRATCQWCLKTNRLDLVGSSNFLSAFEMLGYVLHARERKRLIIECIEWLVSVCGLPFERLFFAVNEAFDDKPADDATPATLALLGVPEDRITRRKTKWAYPFKPQGCTGPHLLFFYDLTGTPCSSTCSPGCTCQRFFHFWNIEFLEYYYDGASLCKAARTIADSAGGLERLLCVASGTAHLYQTCLFEPIVANIRSEFAAPTVATNDVDYYVVAEHSRSVCLLLGVGVKPAANKHGYILRKILRRVITVCYLQHIPGVAVRNILRSTSELYQDCDPLLKLSDPELALVDAEVDKLNSVIKRGYAWYREYVFRSSDDPRPRTNYFNYLHGTIGVPEPIVDQWFKEDGISR